MPKLIICGIFVALICVFAIDKGELSTDEYLEQQRAFFSEMVK